MSEHRPADAGFFIAIRRDPRMNRVIAKDYGVFETTISSIKHRKTWKHVQ